MFRRAACTTVQPGATETRDEVRPHDHAICLYDDRDDLAGQLGSFLEEGDARGEVMIFIHSLESDDEARQLVHQAYPRSEDLIGQELFLIRLYRDAFESGGRIDYDHVGKLVEGHVAKADAQGRPGLRIFVDASRRYFEGAREAEWFAFEEWLGRRLVAKVALVCAYRAGDLSDPGRMATALRTHLYRFHGEDPA